MAALEVLTNQGSLAMNIATASGPRLVIEGARVGLKSSFKVEDPEHPGQTVTRPETVDSYATLTMDDLDAAWGSGSADLVNVSCMPSRVTTVGDDAPLYPQDAVDIELDWLPTGAKEFDTIAVIARLYYGYAEYLAGSYVPMDIVWFRQGNGTIVYYECTDAVDVTNADTASPPDSGHWQQVTMTDRVIGSDPPLRAAENRAVLLYVCTTAQPIKVTDSIELSYKLRLFITNSGYARSEASTYPIYLESLYPNSGAADQLNFLAEMAQTMQSMREVAIANLTQGG